MTVHVSRSIPKLPEPFVSRPEYVEAIERQLKESVDVVVLTDAPGWGRTTLAAEFVYKHAGTAFCTFIRQATRWGYDPQVIQHDIANQLTFTLTGEELHSDIVVDDSLLRSLYVRLSRIKSSKPFYFVIDGLDEIPSTDHGFATQILQLIPFGLPNCTFVLTGVATLELLKARHPLLVYSTLTLAGFSLSQLRDYFCSYCLTDQQLEALRVLTSGIPQRVATVLRLLKDGNSATDILSDPARFGGSLFEVEWKKALDAGETALDCLAVMAFDDSPRSLQDVAGILELDQGEVRSAIDRLPFVLNDVTNATVSFESEALRSYAKVQLRYRQRRVQEATISWLIRDPNSDMYHDQLPRVLRAAGRFKELVAFLSPDVLRATITRHSSLLPLRQRIEAGVEAAQQEADQLSLVRFALSNSLLADISRASPSIDRIRAYLSLKDVEGARELAETAPLVEDRLHLLAIVARSYVESKLTPPQEVLDLISRLAEQLDPSGLGDRVADIAADLVFSLPELAVKLVEATTDVDRMDVDMMLLHLSLRAREVAEADDALKASAGDVAKRSIRDPSLQKLADALQLVVRNTSASNIVDEVRGMDFLPAQLSMLRAWTDIHRARSDAGPVILLALDLLVADSSRTVTAREVRMFARPLPAITDSTEALEIVRRIDGLRGTLERFGSTTEFLKLQLLLAEAEMRHGEANRAVDRLTDVCLRLDACNDLSSRAESAAAALDFCEKAVSLQDQLKKEGVADLLSKELDSSIDKILADAASHFVAVKDVVSTLAPRLLPKALSIAERLNTQQRRDSAYALACRVAATSRAIVLDTATFARITAMISDRDIKDDLLGRLASLAGGSGIRVSDESKFVTWIASAIREMSNASLRCRSTATLVAALGAKKFTTGDSVSQSTALLAELSTTWSSVDRLWEQVRLAYEAAHILAPSHPEVALEYVRSAEERASGGALTSNGAAEALMRAAHLAIVAAGGLIQRHGLSEADIERIAALIERIPSCGEQARLWADLAERAYISDDDSLGRRLVDDRVRPALRAIDRSDGRFREDTLVMVAAALYKSSPAVFHQEFEGVSTSSVDMSLSRVAAFLLRKAPTQEPYEAPPEQAVSVGDREIREVLQLCDSMSDDGALGWVLCEVAHAVQRNANPLRISREQREDIASRIEAIAAKRFPCAGGIQHDGYIVLSRMCAVRVRGTRKNECRELIALAKAIPNASDRVLLLGELSRVEGKSPSVEGRQAVKDAAAMITSLPVAYDRASRSQWIADRISTDKSACKEVLKQAITNTIGLEGGEAADLQRKTLDAAFRLDPTLANELCVMLDDDPAKIMGAQARKHLRVLEARRQSVSKDETKTKRRDKVPSGLEGVQAIKRTDRGEVVETAWRSVAAINGTSLPARGVRDLQDELVIASEGTLEECYPIFLLTVTGTAKLYADTDQATTLTKGVFEACLRAAEIVVWLHENQGVDLSLNQGRRRLKEGGSIVTRPGDRDQVEADIKQWLAANAREEVIICDPYFSVKELVWVKWIQEVCGDVDVKILTGISANDYTGDTAEEYQRTWNQGISTGAPPPVEVTIAYADDAARTAPIHDRWWITRDAGIRFGTSLNSAGETRVSEIVQLSRSEVEERRVAIDEYVTRRARAFRGTKMRYKSFTL